jgi:hypothetical protein
MLHVIVQYGTEERLLFKQMLHVIVQYGTEERLLTEKEKTLYCRDLYSKILLSSVHKENKEHEVCRNTLKHAADYAR